jgi:hypothetical protein
VVLNNLQHSHRLLEADLQDIRQIEWRVQGNLQADEEKAKAIGRTMIDTAMHLFIGVTFRRCGSCASTDQTAFLAECMIWKNGRDSTRTGFGFSWSCIGLLGLDQRLN